MAQVFAPVTITVKHKLRRKFLVRLQAIWRSSLSARQKTTSTNTWATAVCQYYFPTIPWGPLKLNQLDTTMHRNLSIYQAHRRNAFVTSPPQQRRQRLTSLRHAWEQAVVGMMEYLRRQSEPWLRGVLQYNMWRCASLKPNLIQDAMGILSRYDVPLPWEHAPQNINDQTGSNKPYHTAAQMCATSPVGSRD